MNQKLNVGVGVGVGALVVFTLLVVAVVVCCRTRRYRKSLRKKATLRPHSTITTLDVTTVESQVTYRISRDVLKHATGEPSLPLIKIIQERNVPVGEPVSHQPNINAPPPPVGPL